MRQSYIHIQQQYTSDLVEEIQKWLKAAQEDGLYIKHIHYSGMNGDYHGTVSAYILFEGKDGKKMDSESNQETWCAAQGNGSAGKQENPSKETRCCC